VYTLTPLILLYAIIPVILDGVERKLKAALQSRIGPPVTQTIYDLLKLVLVKEIKTQPTILYVYLSLTSSIVTGLASLYYITLYALRGDQLDMFYALALFAITTSTHTVTPLIVPNPYSFIGGIREVVLGVVNEAALITSISLYTIMAQRSVLKSTQWVTIIAVALVALTAFIASYVASSRVPFDIAEAEPEVASGIFVEFSGSVLALNIYSLLLRRLIVKLLVLAPTVGLLYGFSLTGLLVVLLLLPVTWVTYATVAVILGRSRVDVAPLTLAKIYIALILISITVLLVQAYA
jgi:formate hydrogenlyase subunit 4